jgi:predicted dehydrogenase
MATENTAVRIALLGCGRVAQHYRAMLTERGVTGFRVVGCCDPEIAKARDMAATFGAQAYADADAMLAEARPDLVCVLTPSGTHYEQACRALAAGCHVIVEKPVTLVPDQVEALANYASQMRRMATVMFQNRFNPAIRALKQAYDAGRFGRIVSATIRVRWCRTQDYYDDDWHGTWAQDGGVINQQAIHHVDALEWICGPVKSVSAAATRRLNDLEAEDTMVASVAFANGALGTIEATTAARPRDFEASLSVVGEKGMVVVGGIALNRIETWTFVDSRPDDDSVPQRCSQDVPTGYGLSHATVLQEVFDRLRAGSIEPPVPVEDAGRAVWLVHGLYASDEQRRWVDMAERTVSARLGRSRS